MNALVDACASRVWLMKAYMIPALRPFKSIPEVEGETSLSRMLSCLALKGMLTGVNEIAVSDVAILNYHNASTSSYRSWLRKPCIRSLVSSKQGRPKSLRSIRTVRNSSGSRRRMTSTSRRGLRIGMTGNWRPGCKAEEMLIDLCLGLQNPRRA